MTTPSDADEALADNPFSCTIPLGGPNEPRALAISGDLPVVLRDPILRPSEFEAFSCKVREDNPDTPDRVAPDVAFTLEVHTDGNVTMPDGERVHFWGFEDPATEVRNPFPSPLMRVREGQVVHTTLLSSKNTHTIHHHGIEPIPHNDGVGHTSFEVDDIYTYQWRPSNSGSYFYHCHKNTVLHFELGMYGPLIVDPPAGEGFVRRGREVVTYDHEAIWITDDVDPLWHDPEVDHSLGLECDDSNPTGSAQFDQGEHLLRFDPKYWLLSGVPHPTSRSDPKVAVNCRVGERVLVRLLNAAYGPIVVRLPFDAEVIGLDGHALGGDGVDRYSWPFVQPAGSTIELSTAQRQDLLLVPDRAGVFTVAMDFNHWVRGTNYGRVETTITVTD